MPGQVLVYSPERQPSKAMQELDRLRIPYTSTTNILKDILLTVEPVCAVFEGADAQLVEFCRFLLQSNISTVVVNPKSSLELEIAYEGLSMKFEPWVLDKLRSCEYDVARGVQQAHIEATELVTELRLEDLRHDPALKGVAFNVWQYSANDLVVLGAIMFEYALERAGIHVKFERVLYLMLVLRSCYGFRGYHCFRHIIDVAQYVYNLDVNGLCYHDTETRLSGPDACALIVCALGHDLLHPNVTTPTVVKASPEWANKFECLENFHYTVYMSLLRPLVPELVAIDGMVGKLHMLTAATEMKLHSQYLARPLGETQDEDKTAQLRDNFLCLVIKMADICNCSRIFDSSIRQTVNLGAEIAGEVRVRDQLQLSPGQHSATSKPTTNFGQNEKEIWTRIQRDQVGFSKAFYLPIWEKLYNTTSTSNQRLFGQIKDQYDVTTDTYLSNEVPEGFFF